MSGPCVHSRPLARCPVALHRLNVDHVRCSATQQAWGAGRIEPDRSRATTPISARSARSSRPSTWARAGNKTRRGGSSLNSAHGSSCIHSPMQEGEVMVIRRLLLLRRSGPRCAVARASSPAQCSRAGSRRAGKPRHRGGAAQGFTHATSTGIMEQTARSHGCKLPTSNRARAR